MEVPQAPPDKAELEKTPESYGAFQLDALSDSQIVRLVRFFNADYDARVEEAEEGGLDEGEESGDLWELLKVDMRAMVVRDLERAKNLLATLKDNEDEDSKLMAAVWAPSFASIDRDLTIDTLLDLAGDTGGPYAELREALFEANDELKELVPRDQYSEYIWRANMLGQGSRREHLTSGDAYRSSLDVDKDDHSPAQ